MILYLTLQDKINATAYAWVHTHTHTHMHTRAHQDFDTSIMVPIAMDFKDHFTYPFP